MEKKKVGTSWQKLTGTGPYYSSSSVVSRLFSGESNILGRRATSTKKEVPAKTNAPTKKETVSKSISEVSVTAKKKVVPQQDSMKEMNTPVKKSTPISKTSSKKNPSKTSAKSSPDRSLEAAKMLGGKGGLSEDNAVMKRLKQRAMERAVKKAKGK